MSSTLSTFARFAAFVLVGTCCLALNTLALWVLTAELGIHYLASTVIAFSAITPLGFFLNKVVTFRTHPRHTTTELPRYFVAVATSFGANIALMYLLVSVLAIPYLPASLLVAAALVAANFAISDRWSFRTRR